MNKRIKMLLLIAVILISTAISVYASSESKITYDYGAADIRREYIENENPDTYSQGTAVSLNEPSCDGFEFDGWYLDSDYSISVSEISADSTGDITLYAKWYEMSYSISYVLTSPGVPVSSSQTENLNVTTHRASEEVYLYEPSCTLTEYTFDGWYTDESYTQKIEIISAYTCEDLTLYAHWVNSEFTVFYELGSVSASVYPVINSNPSTYTYGEAYTLTDVETDDPAYTFEGWYKDEFFSEPISEISDTLSGDITLYANWIKTEYKIDYVLADDSGIKASDIENMNDTVRTADVDFVLSDPETNDKSYTFAGWYTSPNLSSSSKVTKINAGMSENITLYAKWEKAVYRVSYDYGIVNELLSDIDNQNPDSYEYGSSITLNQVTASGFIFNGWCTDKELKNTISEITPDMYGDITLYADFTEKTYTINYIVEDKEVEASQIVNTNQTVRTTSERVYLEDLQSINTDFIFGGWYYDAEFTEKVDYIKAYTAKNVTVYAKWIKNTSYVPVWGDATLSAQLTAADARIILRYSAGLETSFTDVQIRLSDVNNDSVVTASDARLVLRLSAKLEDIDDLIKEYNLPEISLKDGEVVFS